MSKHTHPEFHKALLEQAAYPAAPRKVKCDETARSYLYRTGQHVYKVRKASIIYSSVAIQERYALEALRLGTRWAGDCVEAVVPILKTADGYSVGGPGSTASGESVAHALRMVQIPDSHWLHRMLDRGNVGGAVIDAVADHLAGLHAEFALDERSAVSGRPEQVESLLDEVGYQSRKYVGQTVTQPVLDMIAHSLGKYLAESRKLLLRRAKRGRVVDGHGAYVPEHIAVHNGVVRAFSALDAQQKFRQLDATNDLALFLNALALRGDAAHETHAEPFLKRYGSVSKDRDVPRLVPIYRVLQALRYGLRLSEQHAELEPEAKSSDDLKERAGAYYNLALHVSRTLPKPT